MSRDTNFITIEGNLGGDIDLRYTNSGTAVTTFSLAFTTSKKSASGEWEDKDNWIDVTAWGTLAERLSESVGKGARVVVIGRLEQDEWEKDGEKRRKIAVVADSVTPSLRFATVEITRVKREDG